MKTLRANSAIAGLLITFLSASTLAADAPIYGSQIMTDQERMEHRQKLRSATTAQEREQVRLQHHEQMKLRAKERGIVLPDEPPARGGGMGPASTLGDGRSR